MVVWTPARMLRFSDGTRRQARPVQTTASVRNDDWIGPSAMSGILIAQSPFDMQIPMGALAVSPGCGALARILHIAQKRSSTPRLKRPSTRRRTCSCEQPGRRVRNGLD